MSAKQLVTGAAWLWLPLFVAACIAVGFVNSASGSSSTANTCAQSSHLDRFLGCP